jgi:hypothetical protein
LTTEGSSSVVNSTTVASSDAVTGNSELTTEGSSSVVDTTHVASSDAVTGDSQATTRTRRSPTINTEVASSDAASEVKTVEVTESSASSDAVEAGSQPLDKLDQKEKRGFSQEELNELSPADYEEESEEECRPLEEDTKEADAPVEAKEEVSHPLTQASLTTPGTETEAVERKIKPLHYNIP